MHIKSIKDFPFEHEVKNGVQHIYPQSGTLEMFKFISTLDSYLFLEIQSLIYIYLLNISKACLGAGGMLHFGVAD